MATIKELLEQQARIATEARAKFGQITDKTPEADAAAIEREFDAMMAEHDRIGANVERLRKLDDIDKRANDLREQRRPQGEDVVDERRAARESGPTYREAFFHYATRGEHNLTPEERAVLQAGVAGPEQRVQVAGTNSAGGYTVPTELLSQIDIAMKAFGPMYDPGVTSEIVTSGGNPLKLPTIDDTSGVAAAHTEGGAVTDDGGVDVTVGQKSLDAYAFDTEWLRISWELGADSIYSWEALIGQLLGERMARTANSQLTVGTGSSAPNGIVTASALGKTAASTTAITSDEILDLVHSVDPAYRQSPKFGLMFNDATLNVIRKLKDGNGNYLWQMGDVTKGAPGSLLGYRYFINQAVVSIGAAAKVMLAGDFGKYYVRKVGQPWIITARERFAPDVGMLGLIRFDGEIANAAAVKHLIMAAS